jgi:hypothetical protein
MSTTVTTERPKPAICPECRVGKHGNCDTGAWDFDTDMPTRCDCWANNHEGSRR